MNERNNLVSASSDSLAGIYWLDYDKIMESYMSSNSFVEQDILGKTVYVGFYRIKQPGLVYGDGTSLPAPDQSE